MHHLKKDFIATIFLLIPFFSFAQPKPFTLTGSIKMNTGEEFPYKILFTESGGAIKGHSFTYTAPDDTKTAITGKLDKSNRTLTFKETEIIYSHDVRTKAYMCLIDARAQYVQGTKGRVLSGSITGAEADKTACTDGVVTFDKQDELKLLFEGKDQFDTVITMGKRPKQQPVAAPGQQKIIIEEPIAPDKITKGTDKTYEWHSDTVIIDIWDGGVSDGDQVTIEYNGRTYLSKHVLSKQKRQLRLPVSPTGMDIITILADNEGWDPPNTATLMLTDGITRHSVVSYNPKGQISVIKIKRAK